MVSKKSGIANRIVGSFFGTACGDALGMPLEMMTFEQINNNVGFITDYIRPDGHKWFDGREAGEWTDDWLFSSVIAESLITKGEIDLDDIAERSIVLYKQGDLKKYGCGKATRMAIKNLAEEVHWSKSGIFGSAGNGIAMKMAPIGAYIAVLEARFRKKVAKNADRNNFDEEQVKAVEIHRAEMQSVYKKIIQLALMTHKSNMAAISGLFHSIFIANLILGEEIIDAADNVAGILNNFNQSIISNDENPHDLFQRMAHLFVTWAFPSVENWQEYSKTENIIKNYGAGSAYVYDSLPFSYAFFLRNPDSIKTFYEVVNAGGDTDTSGAIVGSLLGARHGMEIFPEHLIKGLWRKDEILKIANDFCDRFNVKD